MTRIENPPTKGGWRKVATLESRFLVADVRVEWDPEGASAAPSAEEAAVSKLFSPVAVGPVMLQHRTEDRYRGRVFATEWLLLTGADTLSILAASLLLETGSLTLRGSVFVFALVQIVSGLIWLATIVPAERRDVSEENPVG